MPAHPTRRPLRPGGRAGRRRPSRPVPWKLLDDAAIWTQRRHALPVPPRGPVTFRAAACTLCPAGCALRVRCVGARPVAVRGRGRGTRSAAGRARSA